jgi:hypothetical protein
MTLDIEIHDEWGADTWPQSRYLVHSASDVLWTNSIDDALAFLKQDLLELEKEYKE